MLVKFFFRKDTGISKGSTTLYSISCTVSHTERFFSQNCPPFLI